MKAILEKMATVIRWLLGLGLCYGVWTETGIWTTIAIFLIFIGSEISGFLLKSIVKK